MKYIAIALLTLIPGVANGADFVVTGVSGEQIVLDRMWDRGCLPGTGGNDWTLYQRTLTNLNLTTTLTDFQNGSPSPDCENGQVGFAEYSQDLTADNVSVEITWVDFEGNPAQAPQGLENVTHANGASGLITQAKVIPQAQKRADQLNSVAFCGYSGWEVGQSPASEIIIQCFTGGINPGKGTILVDDRNTPWKIYDGLSINPGEYPTAMPNFAPHEGPFEPN